MLRGEIVWKRHTAGLMQLTNHQQRHGPRTFFCPDRIRSPRCGRRKDTRWPTRNVLRNRGDINHNSLRELKARKCTFLHAEPKSKMYIDETMQAALRTTAIRPK